MNIALIMAGGIGRRFGSIVPKQFQYITESKQIIDYVVDAVENARSIDRFIVVMDANALKYFRRMKETSIEIAPNGNERNESLKNGLDYIYRHYDCDKIIVLDSVAPLITSELIDIYIEKLNEYDAVITAQHITGGLTDKNSKALNRDDYIITQSPEAFRFKILYEYFSQDTNIQEAACQLPLDAKRYYDFHFINNIKLTYGYELNYIKVLLEERENNKQKFKEYKEGMEVLYTEGLKSYLIRQNPIEVNKWILEVWNGITEIFLKWGIVEYSPLQTARFGLVLSAKSKIYGDVIIKYVPGFLNRYEFEVQSYKMLSTHTMCPLLDTDLKQKVLLLKKVKPAKYASFDDNLALTNFFNKIYETRLPISKAVSESDIYLQRMYNVLINKMDHIMEVTLCQNEIKKALDKSIVYWKKYFSNDIEYYCHHDLHKYNLLKSDLNYVAVDPIGMAAPFEFELVRFVITDVQEHESFGFKERIHLLMGYFSKWGDLKKLYVAMFIFMSYITYNGSFESDDIKDTEKNLDIINVLEDILVEKGIKFLK